MNGMIISIYFILLCIFTLIFLIIRKLENIEKSVLLADVEILKLACNIHKELKDEKCEKI